MTTTEIIASVSIIAAFTSATLVTYFNYRFGVRTKKLDILFTNRLIAFKDVSSKIVAFNNYCIGRSAHLQGSEYSPFYEEEYGALHHRTEIANSMQSNSIFLSKASREIMMDVLNEMSILCNVEAAEVANPDESLNMENVYYRMQKMSESAIEVLYQELGIAKV